MIIGTYLNTQIKKVQNQKEEETKSPSSNHRPIDLKSIVQTTCPFWCEGISSVVTLLIRSVYQKMLYQLC